MNVDQQLLARLRGFRDRSDRSGVIGDDHLDIQARLSRRLYDRLISEPAAAVVLASRTGTGKTVVSLVTALQTLQDRSEIDRICVLAPNVKVADNWRRTAALLLVGRDADRLSDAPVPGPGQLSTVSVGQLSSRDIGQLPAGTLVILDEAHRGTQTPDGKDYQRLATVCRDRPVLLVSATPYQLSTDGLVAMLSVNNDRQRTDELEHVRRLAGSLRHLLLRGADIVPSRAELDVLRTTVELAHHTIGTHLINVPPGEFPNTDYRPAQASIGEVELAAGAAALQDGWPAAYWTARAAPVLVERRLGDTFNRALDSSCEGFWATEVGKRVKGDARPEVEALRDLLTDRLGDGVAHPKVAATVDWVAGKVAERRHVIVFAHFLATQAALEQALDAAIDPDAATVVAPKGTSIPARVIRRLRRVPSDGEQSVVLVVTDKFSESIDLDGGQPCVVHHDLPWNPNRLRQRMGRMTRISSGFQRVEDHDVYLPVLAVPTDLRLLATITKRIELGDQLIPAEVEDTLELRGTDLHDSVIEVLAEVRQAAARTGRILAGS